MADTKAALCKELIKQGWEKEADRLARNGSTRLDLSRVALVVDVNEDQAFDEVFILFDFPEPLSMFGKGTADAVFRQLWDFQLVAEGLGAVARATGARLA